MQKSRHLRSFRPQDLAVFCRYLSVLTSFVFCDEIFEIRLGFLPGMDGLSKVSCLRIVGSHINTLSCILHGRVNAQTFKVDENKENPHFSVGKLFTAEDVLEWIVP